MSRGAGLGGGGREDTTPVVPYLQISTKLQTKIHAHLHIKFQVGSLSGLGQVSLLLAYFPAT